MVGYRIGLWQSRMGAGDGPVADGIVPLKTELLRQQDVGLDQIQAAAHPGGEALTFSQYMEEK